MSSVFTSLNTETLTIPHDPPNTVTIRQLSPGALKAATRASQVQSMKDLREMGGTAFLKELRDLSDKDVKDAVSKDPMLLYDRVTLLNKGIIEWTYDKERTPAVYEDLNEQTGAFIAEAILRLANPKLFQSDEEQEVASKND